MLLHLNQGSPSEKAKTDVFAGRTDGWIDVTEASMDLVFVKMVVKDGVGGAVVNYVLRMSRVISNHKSLPSFLTYCPLSVRCSITVANVQQGSSAHLLLTITPFIIHVIQSHLSNLTIILQYWSQPLHD